MTGWPEVIIFDCDGVLVDSETIALARTREALGRAGLALSDDEVRRSFPRRQRPVDARHRRARPRRRAAA